MMASMFLEMIFKKGCCCWSCWCLWFWMEVEEVGCGKGDAAWVVGVATMRWRKKEKRKLITYHKSVMETLPYFFTTCSPLFTTFSPPFPQPFSPHLVIFKRAQHSLIGSAGTASLNRRALGRTEMTTKRWKNRRRFRRK